MSALSIKPPYPAFAGADGLPLENGYIWVGTANLNPQVNPIAVYWDSALTIPAALPIRTLNGYPSYQGTPARFYVGSEYSIQVLDSKGKMVYTSLNGNGDLNSIASYTDLRSYTGTQNLIYITGATNTSRPLGIAGTFQVDPSDNTSVDNGGTIIVGVDGRRWKRDFSGPANPVWFGADPFGVVDSFAAFVSASSSHNAIEFPPGNFRLTDSPTIAVNREVSITGSGQGVTNLVFENQSGLVVNMFGFTVPREFTLARMSLLSNSTGGTALSINRTSTNSIESGINLMDLTICGFEGAHDPDKWFARAIDINNSRFITLDNVRIWGKEFNDGSAIDGVRIRTTNITQAQFQVFVDKLSIGNYRTGFRVEGNVEGIYWNKSEIFACRNPLVVDRTGATLSGTVLIGEAHFNGSGDVLVLKNITTFGFSNSEAFHGFNESGGPFGSAIITVEGSRYTRIVGSKISSSLASIPFDGVKFVGAQESFIGGGSVIRGFSRHGIDIATSSTISVDGVRIIGNSSTTSRGIVIDAASNDIDIGHAPTTGVLIGLVDNSGKAVRQYIDYVDTVIFTLTGGAPTESINITIPTGYYTSKPTYVDVVANTSTTNQSLLCAYHFDAPESTATNARITVRTPDGSNIIAGPKRFMFRISK
jgi:hypothetical protein